MNGTCYLAFSLLTILLLPPFPPVFANHERIVIELEKSSSGFYIEGDDITTNVIISTDNVFGHEERGPGNETFYFLSIRDASIDTPALSLPDYNRTLTVSQNSMITHPYTRQLTAGSWVLTVEIREDSPTGELLDQPWQQPIVVKPAEFRVIERQALAEERNADWAERSVIASLVAAVGGGFVGSYFTRRYARQQWQETKGEMQKDRDISKGSLDLIRDEMRPWVGPSAAGLQVFEKGVFAFNFKNYGKLPARNVRVELAVRDTKFTRQELLDKELSDDKQSLFLPDEIKHKRVKFDFTKRDPPGPSLYLGILIRYDFGQGKSSLYGSRIEYRLNEEFKDMFDEWAEDVQSVK